MPSLRRSFASRSPVLALAFAAGVGAATLYPSRARAVPTPCTKDLQGVGAIDYGWHGIRTDGSVWRPLNTSDPSEAARRDPDLGNDNVALADPDGEAIHQCVLKMNGDVWCWGINDGGELGTGMVTPEETKAVKVVGLPMAAKALTIGIETTCALLIDGSVWCWGTNEHGQLGNGTIDMMSHPTPQQVTALGTGNSAISAGFWHVCALKAGTVSCWGDNIYGEVGAGFFNGDTTSPTVVTSNVKQLSAGGFFTCTVKNDNSMWCWGDDHWGEMGNGTNSDSTVPVQVAPLGNTVSYIDTAVHAVCAVVTGGAVKCWGSPQSGRLGNGVNESAPAQQPNSVRTPQPVSGPLGQAGANIVSLRMSEGAACAFRNDGHVFCWGGGGFIDGTGQSSVPVEVDFCSLPTFDAITPHVGAYAGGTPVTITGTEFKTGAKVKFGTLAPVDATFVDATKLTLMTPAYPFTDIVDVTVTNPDGHYATIGDGYSFTAPPALYQATPGKGSTAGGDMIALEGNNLDMTVGIAFDGVASPSVTWMDAQHVTAVTPPHAAGTVDVTATNSDGQSYTFAAGFTYSDESTSTVTGTGSTSSTTDTSTGTSTDTSTGTSASTASVSATGGNGGGGDNLNGPGHACYCSSAAAPDSGSTGGWAIAFALGVSLAAGSRRRPRS